MNLIYRILSIILVCFFIVKSSNAQESTLPPWPNPKDLLSNDDKLPNFPGGDSLMKLFIQENSPYKVYFGNKDNDLDHNDFLLCSFLINEDGTLSNIKVERSQSENFTKLITRIVEKMPKWTPAEKDGKIVAISKIIILSFGEKLME